MDRTNAGGGGVVQVTRNYSRNDNNNAYGPAISMSYTGPMTAGQYMRVSTNKPFHGANGYFFGGYLIG